jgi:hypothetical protein
MADMPIMDLTTPRTWLYGLTADEWLHLAAEGQDSEVSPCCGNLSELRGALNWLTTSQGDCQDYLAASAVMRAYHLEGDQHNLVTGKDHFPLLHRVLDGIRAAHPELEPRAIDEARDDANATD